MNNLKQEVNPVELNVILLIIGWIVTIVGFIMQNLYFICLSLFLFVFFYNWTIQGINFINGF